jgi:hypothetical protein
MNERPRLVCDESFSLYLGVGKLPRLIYNQIYIYGMNECFDGDGVGIQ